MLAPKPPGLQLTCVEPGRALAAAARRNLSAYDVTVVEERFEQWRPGDRRFPLVFAATATWAADQNARWPPAANASAAR